MLAGGASCALTAGVVLVGGCGGLCGRVLPAVCALIIFDFHVGQCPGSFACWLSGMCMWTCSLGRC